MTQNKAYFWWNEVANYGSDLTKTPVIPSPTRMCDICHELAPILHTHLSNLSLPDKFFWAKARETVRMMTRIEPFPDPVRNFPLFVLYLYTFREVLKPTNIENCLLYATNMCPTPPANFFIEKYIFAISDPVLVVCSFHKMQEIGFDKWAESLKQEGAIERIFDLFIPFLFPQTPGDDDHVLNTKLYLGDFLTNLLINSYKLNTYSDSSNVDHIDQINHDNKFNNTNFPQNNVKNNIFFNNIIKENGNNSENNIKCSDENKKKFSNNINHFPNNNKKNNKEEINKGNQNDNNYMMKKIAISLHKSLHSIVESITEAESVPFMRIIFNLNELCLASKEDELIQKVSDKIISTCSKSVPFRRIVLIWAIRHIDNIGIKARAIAAAIVRSKIIDFWTLEYLSDLLMKFPEETASIIVPFFARILFLNTIFMRTAADIIAKYFNLGKTDQTVREWFHIYLRCVFIAIHIFCSRKKYMNRIFSFISVLNESSLMTTDFIKDSIMESVSNCFGQNTQFLGKYFFENNFSKENVNSSYFSDGIKRMKVFPLKNLPFSQNGTSLLPVIKNVKVEPNVFVDPRVADLGIESEFSQFLYVDDLMNNNEKTLLKYSLEDLIDNENKLLDECRETFETHTYIDVQEICQDKKMLAIGCNSVSKDVEKEVFRFQKMRIDQYICSIKELIRLVGLHPHLGVLTRKLQLYFDKDRSSSPDYATIRSKFFMIKRHCARFSKVNQQKSFSSAAANEDYNTIFKLYNSFIDSNLPNTTNSASNSLISATTSTTMMLFDCLKSNNNDLIMFISPENSFDSYFAQMFEKPPFKQMVDAASHLAKESAYDSLGLTISGIAENIMEEIGLNSIQFKAIVHTSLIRAIFSNAYSEKSDLSQNGDDNSEFLKRALSLSKQPLKCLGLETVKGISDPFVNDSIELFFGQKIMPTLKWLMFETNPLDITYVIHKALQEIAQIIHLPRNTLTQRELEAILYGLLITSPPENVMGIAKFLMKWENLYIFDNYNEVRLLFIKAVSSVMRIDL